MLLPQSTRRTIVPRGEAPVRRSGEPQDGFRFGWPLIRLGTDLTLKVGTAASQYLLAIGSLRRAVRRDAREMRFAAGAQCKTIAGARRGSARNFSRWMGSRGVTHSSSRPKPPATVLLLN